MRKIKLNWSNFTLGFYTPQDIAKTTMYRAMQPFFWIFMGILIKVGLTYFDTVAYNFILSSSVTLTYLLSDFTYLTCVIENILYATGLRHGKKE